MGMSTGGKPGGLQTEINVTPLIDVVLVLLIIFLVTMPIMMKMVTLEVPRKLDDSEMADPEGGNPITIVISSAESFVLNDGDKDKPVTLSTLGSELRPLLDKKPIDKKVVFVDYKDMVPWNVVVETMDQIRSVATDKNHDDVKVALKLKEDAAPAQ